MIVDGVTTEIHLDGEFSDAIQWQPFALDKLRQMIRSGYRGLRVMRMGDVQLRVWLDPASKLAKVWVKAENPQYMESAYHDLRIGDDLISEEFYRPALIYSVPTIADEDKYNASRARTITASDYSWSCGQKTLSKTVSTTILDSGVSVELASDDAEFCRPGLIKNMKFARLHVPPSMYTGLMRKYVQALYGSDRRDYMAIKNTATFGYHLIVSKSGASLMSRDPFLSSAADTSDCVALPNVSGSCGILHDTATDKFFLVVVNGVYSVFAGEMKSRYPVDSKVKSSEAELIRFIASLSPPKEMHSVTVDMSSLSGYSFPAYQWHFNSNGTSAIGVVIKSVPRGTEDIGGMLTKVCRLSFSIEEGSVVASMSSDGAVEYHPGSAFAFLVPTYRDDGGELLVNVYNPSYANAQQSGTAPVYAYYDDDDVEVVCSIDYSEFQTIPADYRDTSGDPRVVFGTDVMPVGGGTLSYSITSKSSEQRRTTGVSCGSVSYSGTTSSINWIYKKEATVTCPSVPYARGHGINVIASWGFAMRTEDEVAYMAYHDSIMDELHSAVASLDPVADASLIASLTAEAIEQVTVEAYFYGGAIPGTTGLTKITNSTTSTGESHSYILAIPFDHASAVVVGDYGGVHTGLTVISQAAVENGGGGNPWWFSLKDGSMKWPALFTAGIEANGIYSSETTSPTNSYGYSIDFVTGRLDILTSGDIPGGYDDSTHAILNTLFNPAVKGEGMYVHHRISGLEPSRSSDCKWYIMGSLGLNGIYGDWPSIENASPAGVI